jgi:hypothetical protein
MNRKYKLINYDVWGNKNDGWEVNDAHFTGIEIELSENFTDKELKTALYKSGFATQGILMAKISCDGEPDYTLYVNLEAKAYGSKPFCELRSINDEGK